MIETHGRNRNRRSQRDEEASHLEQTRGRVPLYAILPKNKYLNDVFRVKISKPIDLPDRVPSAMDHGFFTFEFLPVAKRRELLEIRISPA
jgi:hypothetical protein